MSYCNAFVNVSGGMSDEFSKKMKEWNELQTTKRFSASQRGGIARFISFLRIECCKANVSELVYILKNRCTITQNKKQLIKLTFTFGILLLL